MFGATGYFEPSPFIAGVVALSLTFGAYATEVLRGAFLAVPRQQTEAAYAIGLNRRQTFRHVLLPQVWRTALPGLGNLFLVLLKDTSLVSVVGLDELMRKSAIAVSYTREPFTFYFAAALIYLAMTACSMAGHTGTGTARGARYGAVNAMAELSRMAAENLPQLLAGAWLTVQLVALAMVTGTALAFALACMRTSRHGWLRAPA